MPQRPRFRAYGRPPLTLVQMRQRHLVLRSQGCPDPRRRHGRLARQ